MNNLIEAPEMPLHPLEVEILDKLHSDRESMYRGEVSALDASHRVIDTIVDSDSLTSLVEIYGANLDADTPATEKIKQLKSISNDKWDFRNGKERQDTGRVELTPEQEDLVFQTADELRMQGETNASRDNYDFITVLGGANQSNLLRMKHLKKQFDNGVSAPYIILLGSDRKVSEKEQENTTNYAPGARTEFDLLNGALESEFGVSQFDEGVIDMRSPGHTGSDPDSWKVRMYTLPNGTTALSVSAPQVEGERRVNTADTYRFMQEVIGKELLEDKEVLNVTTDLYVPFQHADAVRLLGLHSNARIETIGYGGVDRPASSYLQEINSAINQTALLAEALDTTLDEKFKMLGRLARIEEANEWDMLMSARQIAQYNGGKSTFNIDSETGIKNVSPMFGAEDSRRNKKSLIDTATKIEQIRAILTGHKEREV